MKKILLLLAVLCTYSIAFSQDITGLWKGTLLNDSTSESLKYEVVILKAKGRYSGYSHTSFLINGQTYYGVKKLKVSVARDGKIVMQDAELLENNYPVQINKNVRQLNVLDFYMDGSQASLNGPFVTNRTKEFSELTGKIMMTRVSAVSQSDLMQFIRTNNPDPGSIASN
jgi:hypothetical protein